jgi:hypothetical protein
MASKKPATRVPVQQRIEPKIISKDSSMETPKAGSANHLRVRLMHGSSMEFSVFGRCSHEPYHIGT